MMLILLYAFPSLLSMTALYKLLSPMGLINTRTGLIIVYTGTMAVFALWNMKGYFDTIPVEIEEAAMIDGANRWQRMWNITVPLIPGNVVTLLIMNLGRVMGSNFERLDQFGNSQVKDFQYQLAIYVYEKGLAGGKFSMSTFVNLFQSVIGLILVLLSDKFAKKLGEDGLL